MAPKCGQGRRSATTRRSATSASNASSRCSGSPRRIDDGLMMVNLTGAPVDPGDGGGVLPAWGVDVPDGAP